MPCERKHIEAIQAAFDRYGSDYFGVDATISAALAACDESPWRSMDSAPKDGTMVLLWCKYETPHEVVGYFDTRIRLWLMGEDCDDTEPTHWMPLPAAPEGV